MTNEPLTELQAQALALLAEVVELPARRGHPIPTAADFAPFDHSKTDRSRNHQGSPRSSRHRFVL